MEDRRLKGRRATGVTAAMVFLAAAVVGGSVAAGTGAGANHFSGATGATGCTRLNMADNRDHGYHYFQLQSETRAAMNWTRRNNMNPTYINTRGVPLNRLTDVVVLDRYYEDYCGFDWFQPATGGTVGLVTCKSLVNRRCQSHDLRMSNRFTDQTSRSNVRGLACHEDGHTVGLAHRGGSATCMPQGYPKPRNGYDNHDRAVLRRGY